MTDPINTRMKEFYEDRTRYYLPRRTYVIARIDGRAFHTFCRKFNKPFDENFINMMNQTAKYLAENVQGCKMAYVQSDEISLVLTDFDELNTSAWFDGNIQKMVSISASMATKAFNKAYLSYYMNDLLSEVNNSVSSLGAAIDYFNKIKFAEFDARVFSVPTKTEVMNYLVARQKDATRNSVSMVAQSLYSHKELNGKSTNQMQEMMFQKGINWNNFDDGQKRGRCVVRRADSVVSKVEGQLKMNVSVDTMVKEMMNPELKEKRKKWVIENPPIFTEDWTYLSSIIPDYK